MREESKILKKTVATIFANINAKNEKRGINIQYKYENKPIEQKDEETKEIIKGREVNIIMRELGYKDKILQSFKFHKPANIDKFSMEYHVFTLILTALTETSLITWVELGKNLNKDKNFQKEAIKSLTDDKEINSNTDK